MWQERLIAAHTAVTDQVSHSRRLSSERYFVWQEDGTDVLHGDDCPCETVITGSTDFFTKVEFDPWARELERSFCREGIPYSLRDVQYEEETGFYHYTWDWMVTDGDF